MALRFIDGFDHYGASAAATTGKWTSADAGVSHDAGRFGGSSYRVQGNRTRQKTLDSQSEWIVGCGWSPWLDTNGSIMQWHSSVEQVSLYQLVDGRIQARRGSTVLATSTAALIENAWHHLDWRVVLSDTVGVFQLYIDGVLDINLSGADTNNAGGNVASILRLGSNGESAVIGNIDDLYVCDGTGPAPYNTFLGDCRVETLYPNGNGNSSQWDGSDGNSTDNYLLVDEATPDSDTTYVQSPDIGDKDTYAYGNLATTSGDVHAVQLLPYMRKSDAGARSVVTVARLSATEEDSSSIPVPSSYVYARQDIRTTKPGGGAWTVADVNSAEFGIKVNS